jgi:hypothetical protein
VIGLTEQAARMLQKREIRRFHRAVDRVIDGLLLEKYESTRQAEEYRKAADTCALVRSWLHMLDSWGELAEKLFEKTDDRSNWEVYLSGLRRLLRQMPDSYMFRFVLPMFGLEDLREKVIAFSGQWQEQIHASHKFLRGAESYVLNMDAGSALASEYGGCQRETIRLYASLKTWSTNDQLDNYLRDLEGFLTSTVEVFISGPVQLYLMLSRDTMFMIFKALSVGRLNELGDGDKEYAEIMKLSDFVRDALADSEVVATSREVVTRAVKGYVSSLRAEEIRLRAQLPDRATKYSFVQRFESGVLFRSAEEDYK